MLSDGSQRALALPLRNTRAQVLPVGTQWPRVLSEGSQRAWVLPVGNLSEQVPRRHASSTDWVLCVEKMFEASAASTFFSVGNQQA